MGSTESEPNGRLSWGTPYQFGAAPRFVLQGGPAGGLGDLDAAGVTIALQGRGIRADKSTD